MKYLFLFLLFFSSCTQANNTQYRVHDQNYDFSVHNGKTILNTVYENDHGHKVTIYFTDGTQLKLFGNKYVIDVEQ